MIPRLKLMSDVFSRNDRIYPKRCKYCGGVSAYPDTTIIQQEKHVENLRCVECGRPIKYKLKW